MSLRLADFSGDALYLDTMVPYALLRGLDSVAQSLFSRIEQGELQAFTSVLTFDELAYRTLLALIRDNYSGSPLDQLRQHEEAMITEFYPQLAPKLEHLRNFPNLFLLDVTATDLTEMDNAIIRYSLRPRDALHLAAMQKCNCLNIASNDAHFDRVSAVQRYTF